ncbi:type II toxin-antitoxin system HipA family toxin [Desulfonatronum lacustre]|uniref:type II toxin-antitoxin system HipA family toxin n=1 Tax=Desulfonatronum lacustre TaxID=66849 RepID=UPI00048F29F9|nr:type II toxin-antitoxin system HipA family toxin [Desulfonatronum lacustre]
MSREIFVHVDSRNGPIFVGTLWVHEARGRQSATFEYDYAWRSCATGFSLEPALELRKGTFHTDKALFGAIGDSAPDRWGRTLMDRREARLAKLEQRAPRMLLEADYLLMVNDLARQGALRFSLHKQGPFLATDKNDPIPPLVRLGRLLAAAERTTSRTEKDDDLKQLVGPGSSLGGARPKASVLDNDGTLMVAKFPNSGDDHDVQLWEFVSHRLAHKAGLNVPAVRLERIADKNILLLRRFDRNADGSRIPFLSALSMLGASDGEHGSYLEIAEVLREYGARPAADLKELWKRLVFNILIANVDDHLRNHAFLYSGPEGWRLSPLYDLEPTPEHVKPRILHTRIDYQDGTASLELAFDVAAEFGVEAREAETLAKAIAAAVQSWEDEGSSWGASRREIEFMRSAFEPGK